MSVFPDGFEWDEAKRAANLEKHAIDFVRAVEVFSMPRVEREDARRDWGESRSVAIGPVQDRIVTVVYTQRGPNRRIISARRATIREREAYWQEVANEG
ncbi:MAG: BrnT family toxin [Gemmatimonadaceae bacterium]